MSLATQVSSLATRIGTEFKTVRTELATRVGDLAALTTVAKGSTVAAINEVNAKPAGPKIDDAVTAAASVWSSQKTNSSINTAVAGLVNSAPAALDTFAELSAALGADPNFAASTATALGNRVRVDAGQVFTAAQQAQGRANLAAASSTDMGDPATDFVAVFQAALV